MRRRLVRVVTALVMAAGFVGVAAGPAAAQPYCDQPDPPPICEGEEDPGPPYGTPSVSLREVVRQPGGLRVSGTASDPNVATGIQVKIAVGSTIVATLTTSATTSAFSGIVPAAPGSQVCAMAVNQGAGENAYSCRSFTPQFNPFGVLENVSSGISGLTLKGWAVDPDTADPVKVEVYLDGRWIRSDTASQSRPDVATVYPGYGDDHGFQVTVPATPGSHQVCVRAVNVGLGATTEIGCRSAVQGSPPARPSLVLTPAPTGTSVAIRVIPSGTLATSFTIQLRGRALTYPPNTWLWTTVYSRAASGATEFTWTASGLTPATQYCWRVLASNAYGSSYASACTTTPMASTDPLPRPTGLMVTALTANSITLSWTDNAVNEQYYRIDRAGAETITVPGTPTTGWMTQTITGLQPGTRYCFDIGAWKDGQDYDPVRDFCGSTASV
ncbi:fibronectin type III domain-containing protein [Plantactinospora sonchi]|uniref:Fibronectin type III domain-containing protein n=1 Tax=Plantactinospora sonchi TaxID=1544735 RepID=A0ABU7RW02_9ACTN